MLAALLALGAALVGGLEAQGATVQPSSTPVGLTNGPLAYQDGHGQVAITTIGSPEDGNAHGTAPDFPLRGRGPAYSPSGLRVAFSRRLDDGHRQIFVAEADGTKVRPVTHDPADAIDPTWSPSGLTLAFTSTRDGRPEIHTIGVDSTDERRLTDDPGDALQADWSPKNHQIAFVSTRLGTYDVFVMNEDGSNPHPVAATPDRDLDPDWRNDGATLAYSSGTASGAYIYSIGSDGLGLRSLTSSNAVDRSPSWSPTGDAIAFTRQQGGAGSTWVTTVDDTALMGARQEIPGGRRADWGALALPPANPELLDQNISVKPVTGEITLSPPASTNQAPVADAGARVAQGYIVHAPGDERVQVMADVPATQSAPAPADPIEAKISGSFKVLPPPAVGQPALALELRGEDPSCPSGGGLAAGAAKKSKKKKPKKLKIHSNGPVKGVGKHGSGTTKHTQWTIEDTCDGTVFTVTEGTVQVQDFGLGVTVDVSAGDPPYTARG